MHSRYQISVCAGRDEVLQDCPSLDIAKGAFALFQTRERDNRDAHGGIYDREERRWVVNWRGGSKPKPLPTIADVYERLIARGEPVSIIGPDGSASFNEPRSQSRPRRAA